MQGTGCAAAPRRLREAAHALLLCICATVLSKAVPPRWHIASLQEAP